MVWEKICREKDLNCDTVAIGCCTRKKIKMHSLVSLSTRSHFWLTTLRSFHTLHYFLTYLWPFCRMFPKIKLKLKGDRFDITSEIQTESQGVLDDLQDRCFWGIEKVLGSLCTFPIRLFRRGLRPDLNKIPLYSFCKIKSMNFPIPPRTPLFSRNWLILIWCESVCDEVCNIIKIWKVKESKLLLTFAVIRQTWTLSLICQYRCPIVTVGILGWY